MQQQLVSIIIPMYNEAENAWPIYHALTGVFRKLPYDYEMLFVDDGSQDDTAEQIMKLSEEDPRVKPLQLTRNFGKEVALSAGLHAAAGQAAIMIDADLQHPPGLIPKFIKKWEEGADLVVGVRKNYKTSLLKRWCSGLFYKLINRVSDTELLPHATDFRLVDRQVIDAFNRFTERNRITRGLFDWLGYKRTLIPFDTEERQNGTASYSFAKLVKLAVNSVVGHSIFPLRLAGYLGVLIIVVCIPLSIFVVLDRYVLMTPFGLQFSGTAILAVINLILSGVILSCLGLMSLYLAHVHTEATNRPLYVKRPRVKPNPSHLPLTPEFAKDKSSEEVTPKRKGIVFDAEWSEDDLR